MVVDNCVFLFKAFFMANSREYISFIDDYKRQKWHVAYSNEWSEYWTYGSGTGKFGFGKVALDILNDDFDLRQRGLWLEILGMVEKSVHFEKACVVCLVQKDFKHLCGGRFFKNTINMFVEKGLLIRTPEKKYFILSVIHTNMFTRKKEWK